MKYKYKDKNKIVNVNFNKNNKFTTSNLILLNKNEELSTIFFKLEKITNNIKYNINSLDKNNIILLEKSQK